MPKPSKTMTTETDKTATKSRPSCASFGDMLKRLGAFSDTPVPVRNTESLRTLDNKTFGFAKLAKSPFLSASSSIHLPAAPNTELHSEAKSLVNRLISD